MNGINSQPVAFLRGQGWLAGCPAGVQSGLIGVASVIRVDSGATVFGLGAAPGNFYGIASGCIAFEAAPSDNVARTGMLFHPGLWFGEGTLSGRPTRLVGARATRPSTLLAVDLARFRRLAEEDPAFWREIARLTHENSERVMGLARDLMIRGSAVRLASLLCRLAGLREAVQPEPAIIDLTQNDLAEIANLSRTIVSTILRGLERDGVIRLQRAMIHVVDPTELARRTEEA